VASSAKWVKGPSEIHGNGAMASRKIHARENIGPLVMGLRAGGLMGGNRTELGSLLNHQNTPNSKMLRVPGRSDHYYLKSLTDIDPGSEITMSYWDTPHFVAKPSDVDPEGYENWG